MEIARATGIAMGKDVIRAADVPGFIVNRCNRPFGLEALRLLQERIADVETIDRIVRLGGGFRMGPFELSDLVGVDTGFDVSKSFYELSFGEPRWRPSPSRRARWRPGARAQAGRGYYDYSGEGPHRPPTRTRPRRRRRNRDGQRARGRRTARSHPRPGRSSDRRKRTRRHGGRRAVLRDRAARPGRGHRRGGRAGIQEPRPAHRARATRPRGRARKDRLPGDQRVGVRARRRGRLGR